MRMTRTRSPYFSPKSAMALYSLTATSMGTSSMTSTRSLRSTSLLARSSMSCNSSSSTRGEVREVEAQVAGIDQRARLLHVRAQHIAQRGVQQVRAGMVAHGRAAHFVVDHGIDLVADMDRLLGDDAMRAHALHGIGHALDFGDDGVVVVGVEPADVANLSAGIGVEGRVVEHDLAALAGLQLLHADSGAVLRFDDGQHFACRWRASCDSLRRRSRGSD